MSRSALLAALVLGLAQQACSSPCMQIQQQLCQCQGKTQTEQRTCEDAASAQEKLAPPTDAQLAACEALLDSCEAQVAKGCETLDTAEGRKACGISE